jgi:hypothetical protein
VCPEAEEPVPDRATVIVELLAVFVIVTVPVTGPIAAGVKDTVIVAEAPGAIFSPFDMPLREKPAPPCVTFETVMFEPLVFVNVTVRVLEVPTFTFPKATLEVLGFRPEMTCWEDPEAPATPLHPDWLTIANKSAVSRR